jgi:hypothetical protein
MISRLLCILILRYHHHTQPVYHRCQGTHKQRGTKSQKQGRKSQIGVHGPARAIRRRSRAGHSLATLSQDVLRPRHANETRSDQHQQILIATDTTTRAALIRCIQNQASVRTRMRAVQRSMADRSNTMMRTRCERHAVSAAMSAGKHRSAGVQVDCGRLRGAARLTHDNSGFRYGTRDLLTKHQFLLRVTGPPIRLTLL